MDGRCPRRQATRRRRGRRAQACTQAAVPLSSPTPTAAATVTPRRRQPPRSRDDRISPRRRAAPLLPLTPSTLGGRGPAPTLFDWCLLSFGPAELGPAQAERLYPVWPAHPPRSHYLCTSYRLRAAAYHSVPACPHELPRIPWPPCLHHSRRHSPASSTFLRPVTTEYSVSQLLNLVEHILYELIRAELQPMKASSS